MNESNLTFDYSFISDLEVKPKITHTTSSHYGCSNCARILSKGEIIKYFESPQGVDEVLINLNQNSTSSKKDQNDKILCNLTLSMTCPNCEESVEGFELLVSGFNGNNKILGNCDSLPNNVFSL